MTKKRNDLVIVGSGNPPTPPPVDEPIRWRDFKRFIADAETLRD